MEFGEANLSLVTLKAQVKKYEEEGIIQEFDHNSCFNLASSKGLLSCLQYLVELKGVKTFLNDRTSSDWTALHFAGKSNSIETVNYLLSLGFKINQLTTRKENIFLIVFDSQHYSLEFLQYLVSKRINVHQTNKKGCNAFLKAISSPTTPTKEILKYLISLGINIHALTTLKENAILVAAQKQGYKSLKQLHSLQIDVFCENRSNINAITLIYYNNLISTTEKMKSINFLLSIGLKMKGEDYLLLDALRKGDFDLIKYFYSHGANISNVVSNKALKISLSHFNIDLFKFLINNNIDNEKDENFLILNELVKSINNLRNLFLNKFKSFKQSFEYFLSRGNDINTIDPLNQKIPIQELTFPFIRNQSLKKQYFKILKYLMDKGSDFIHCYEGNSLLHSIPSDYRDETSFIILRSLDINRSSLRYSSPIFITTQEDYFHINNDKILLESDFDQNINNDIDYKVGTKKKRSQNEEENKNKNKRIKLCNNIDKNEWKKEFLLLGVHQIPPISNANFIKSN